VAPTVCAATCASSAARSAGRCRYPLTRRNWARASIIPAAHQRSAMLPFCQFFTLAEWVRAMEIIDSMQLVERSVRARVGDTPRRSTVRVSDRPSRRLPAALGIGIDGVKHPLGLVEGSTENTTVVTDLLTGLRERGLDTTRPIFVGIDGA